MSEIDAFHSDLNDLKPKYVWPKYLHQHSTQHLIVLFQNTETPSNEAGIFLSHTSDQILQNCNEKEKFFFLKFEVEKK